MSTGFVVLLRRITIWLSGASFGSGHWIVSLLLVCAWLYLPSTSQYAIDYRAAHARGRCS